MLPMVSLVDYPQEKFITVLFDSFEYIEDEEIFRAVVVILVKISNEEAHPD
jgi:hypothetical protein